MTVTTMHDGRVVLHQADCRDALRSLADNSIDSVVTDPPYALVSIQKRFGKPGSAPAKDVYGRGAAGFMGKQWDTGEVAFSDEFWAEVLRVLKPGGHVVAFSGTRTYHRMAVAIEDAGFEIRDQLGWVYGCLDDQTMAVTAHGVMPYHKIKKGDLVLSYDTTYMSYEWQPVEEVLVYDVDDTAYRISTDLGDQIVSRNHRCIVERGGKETFVFAEEAARQREICVPVLEDLRTLLNAVPGPYERASGAEQDVFEGLRECCDRREGCRVGKADGDAQREVGGELRGLRDGVLAQHETSEARQEAGVQLRVQRSSSRGGVEGARTYRAGELDTGVGGGSCGEDDGRDESGVEGRGYVQESEGELRVGSIRALSGRFSPDVAQGRVCDGASPECGNGDWSSSDAGGVRTPYRPRSAEQRSDEPDAVRDEQGPQVVRAWRGHKTVVGRITPERYRGVIWCVRVKSGAFVAVRNGLAFPTGNSGFPKSHDVSKGIDRVGGMPPSEQASLLRSRREAAGLSRDVLAERVGCTPSSVRDWEEGRARVAGGAVEHITPSKAYRAALADLLGYSADERRLVGVATDRRDDGTVYAVGHSGNITTGGHTDAAAQWQGWGTALKPAWEPICLARKPLCGTVAENVLSHGTGAINVDGCRIEGEDVPEGRSRHGASGLMHGSSFQMPDSVSSMPAGRWPANIIHDGSDEVLAAFPDAKGQMAKAAEGEERRKDQNVYGAMTRGSNGAAPRVEIDKSAARFFYCAKASRADRDAGLEQVEGRADAAHRRTNLEETADNPYLRGVTVRKNTHPTVKPTTLMQWLCRLITPPGGVILDPFMGSGSTGKAAVLEGFQFVGVEREDEYMPIATARIAWAIGATPQEDPAPAPAQPTAANDNSAQSADLFSTLAGAA